jgi:hypothetical protein
MDRCLLTPGRQPVRQIIQRHGEECARCAEHRGSDLDVPAWHSTTEGPEVTTVTPRRARPDEASMLSDLALAAKGFWGYDQAFIESCRDELAFGPDDIARRHSVVADLGGPWPAATAPTAIRRSASWAT